MPNYETVFETFI